MALGTAAVLLLCLGIWVFWYVRSHGFSARDEPSRAEEFVARRLRWIAFPSEARRERNPLDPTPLNIAEGRDHFADHCAICHANDGSGRTQINAGLYPPAPDMRGAVTRDLSDGEIFYIIKNGIRFTGMPGWGGEDEENWKLVLFIRHLPNISQKELDLMRDLNGLEPAGEPGRSPAH